MPFLALWRTTPALVTEGSEDAQLGVVEAPHVPAL